MPDNFKEGPDAPDGDKPRRKVWIAIPVYGGMVCVQTMRSLWPDLVHMLARGWEVYFFTDLGHADIYLLRAQTVARFLEDKDATDLVMIDSDLTWPQYGLVRLLDHDVDIVGCAYPKRCYPIQFMFRSEGGTIHGDAETGLMKVTGLPGGFMRIKRHVLEKMSARYHDELSCVDGTQGGAKDLLVRLFDPYWMTNSSGKPMALSEDYSFCQRWIDMGGEIWMDAFLPMAHIGQEVFKGCVGEALTQKNQNELPLENKEKAA